MARCSTAHGPFRCDKEEGHADERGIATECETSAGPKRVIAIVEPGRDLDSGRELLKAVRRVEEQDARIAVLEKALEEIRTTPCEAVGNASCLCCLHDRMIAAAALDDEAAA